MCQLYRTETQIQKGRTILVARPWTSDVVEDDTPMLVLLYRWMMGKFDED